MAHMDQKSKHKVLIVEDDKFLSTALGDKLGRAGFEVIKALNGEEALEKIKQEQPAVALLDLVMPRKGGFEVLEELKLNGGLATTIVLVLSNLGQKSDVSKAKELGASEFLIKSDTPIKQVVEKVKFYLAKGK